MVLPANGFFDFDGFADAVAACVAIALDPVSAMTATPASFMLSFDFNELLLVRRSHGSKLLWPVPPQARPALNRYATPVTAD